MNDSKLGSGSAGPVPRGKTSPPVPTMGKVDLKTFQRIVFFTGAGMSAESGVPTYRGVGGIWQSYNWEEYACQEAFDRDPHQVLSFHEVRRRAVLDCQPHRGHSFIAEVEEHHPAVTVVTQNIDGLHQRAGSKRVLELHGSLWRLRCDRCGIRVNDVNRSYATTSCPSGHPLRPDIVWFGDLLDEEVVEQATLAIERCDLLVSVGTSGVVWPAAGFPQLAKNGGAYCVEINPEPTEMSYLYDLVLRGKAGAILPRLAN